MKRIVVTILAAMLTVPALAIDQGETFEDPEMQARYERLISEVRCLQCQNQSIKDSNVTLATDLRRQIARMIEDGSSDAEIADFLVTRYGDFVLYRPRMSGKTLMVWIAPFALALIGLVGLVRVVRHRASLPFEDEVEEGKTE
ncbi:MAG: cytochrome c-type biogenesis protein CcmH [Woeseiaceae bacterium]|nr:cytochrome c-type biogenesis protein CcmH [Woeseiaceae bacterium]